MGSKKTSNTKSYEIRVTENANKDFDEITDYIEFVNFQPSNAIMVGESIIFSISKILANPHSYKECKYLPTKIKMYRQTLCLSWNIFYRIRDYEIVILGILHTARKPSIIKKLRSVK